MKKRLIILCLSALVAIGELQAQTAQTRAYLYALWVRSYKPQASDYSDVWKSFVNMKDDFSDNSVLIKNPSANPAGLNLINFTLLGREGGNIMAVPFSYFYKYDSAQAVWNAYWLQGRKISPTAPTNHQVLKWNSGLSEWTPAADTSGGGGSYTAGAGITIASSVISADSNIAIWNANWLHNKLISATMPTNHQVLKWNAGLSEWTPATDTGVYTFGSGVSLSGTTVTGNYSGGTGITITGASIAGQTTTALWNASKLQGVAISPTAPSNHQVLKYNSGLNEWTAATDTGVYSWSTGLTNTSGTITANISNPIWNADKLMNNLVSAATPSNNQVLKWNAGLSEWTPATDTGVYTASGGIVLVGTEFVGDYTASNGVTLVGTDIEGAYSAGTGISISSGVISGNYIGDGSTIGVSSGIISSLYSQGTGILISGGIISADNSTAIWNANNLFGTSINSTAPTNGQVLQYNGSEYKAASLSTIQSGDLMLKSTSAPDIVDWTQHAEITVPLGSPAGYFWYMKN